MKFSVLFFLFANRSFILVILVEIVIDLSGEIMTGKLWKAKHCYLESDFWLWADVDCYSVDLPILPLTKLG